MASNPMQRQKRVSFLLGFLLMLVIASVIIVMLGYALYQMKADEKAEEASKKKVYVVTSSISSGGAVSSEVISTEKVVGTLVPKNKFEDSDFMNEDGTEIIDLVAKIDLEPGTILTKEMVETSSQKTTDDLRIQEYNIATLPAEVSTGDFVDIRMRMTSGVDYIIVSKKEISIPTVAGIDSAETFTVRLTEEETLAMSCAIIEAFHCVGAEIYVDIYTDPGMQAAATPTYHVNEATMNLIGSNPNIVQEAKNALSSRFSTNNAGYIAREQIQNELNKNEDDAQDNIESGIEEHITKQKQFRQQYLEALSEGAE